MKVHYPKLYNMAHLLALNVLLLPKDLTIIFIQIKLALIVQAVSEKKIFEYYIIFEHTCILSRGRGRLAYPWIPNFSRIINLQSIRPFPSNEITV